MGFALPKFAAFGRKRKNMADADGAENGIPVLRRADTHPDAPARSPIYANRDLGKAANLIAKEAAQFEEPAYDMDGAVIDASLLDMPRSPEPLPWDAIKEEIARVHRPNNFPAGPSSTTDIGRLTIAELTARLESGLARCKPPLAVMESAEALQQLAPAPTAVHIPQHDPVRASQQDSDEALQAALATLRGITAKAG